jgi:hypothetical protein
VDRLLLRQRMTPFPKLLLGFLLAPVLAGLLASVLCGLSILRDEKPPWSHAALSVLLGIFCSLWSIFQGDVFNPALWPAQIPGCWDSFAIALMPTIAFTTLAVLIAVALFRERYKKQLSGEQRREPSRQRRHRSWQRMRWFHLFASSMLTACLTTGLVWSHSTLVPSPDSLVASDFQAAYNWNPRTSPAPESQARAARTTSTSDFGTAGGLAWPCLVLALVASGGWFAYTVAYWRGYMRVKPRHLRDLLATHSPPATKQEARMTQLATEAALPR